MENNKQVILVLIVMIAVMIAGSLTIVTTGYAITKPTSYSLEVGQSSMIYNHKIKLWAISKLGAKLGVDNEGPFWMGERYARTFTASGIRIKVKHIGVLQKAWREDYVVHIDVLKL